MGSEPLRSTSWGEKANSLSLVSLSHEGFLRPVAWICRVAIAPPFPRFKIGWMDIRATNPVFVHHADVIPLKAETMIAVEPATAHVASESQRTAIEAETGPILVLAGPGAGKTWCLIERIRFLIEKEHANPARICAFTFTNKAAGEISSRLSKTIGAKAERVKRGTIHAFCAEVLRSFPEQAGLQRGFGIADEDYQRLALGRIGVPGRWRSGILKALSCHRFIPGYSLDDRDIPRIAAYLDFLARRNMVDFDMLVLKTADLFRIPSVVDTVRDQWDHVLVDEFQDLNPIQYGIIHALAKEHRSIFAVGDDEQSIYSWAGADPAVFTSFLNDFERIKPTTELAENRRCPHDVVRLARRLIDNNPSIFEHRSHGQAERSSPFPVRALGFATGEDELSWVIDDLLRDREEHQLDWSDFALLYRTHKIGNLAEAQFIAAGIPCRLARGRAISDDPVVRYLMAALRVIAQPQDTLHQESFLQVVFPRPLFDRVRAKAQEKGRNLLEHLERTAWRLPKADVDGKKLRRGVAELRNLAALAGRHDGIVALADELLSHTVGQYKTMLEVNHDDLSDPAENEEVRILADRLSEAVNPGRTVWIPRLGGIEIGLKGMLAGIEVNRVQLGGFPPANAVSLGHSDCESLGLALGVFKALQLIESRPFTNSFRDFTAVDIETTDNDVATAELVDIAAVRVREGVMVDVFQSLVKPRVPIAAAARDTHGISEEDVSASPFFEDVWPQFRDFCGRDVIVAHNGHNFDFPILRRMAGDAQWSGLATYDTLVLARELRTGSAALGNLAHVYGIDAGQAHRALDDTTTLAHVFLALGEEKVVRSRKISLDSILDHLGVALALSERESLCPEARRLLDLASIYSLGRYSRCLQFYREERIAGDDESAATVEDLIDRLGGEERMLQLRTDRSAEERYPEPMLRLRPLLQMQDGKPLPDQIAGLLERITLSKRAEGVQPETGRVNLLTLHSTKGLEFSRVYILGTDNDGFGRGEKSTKEEIQELRRLLYVGMTRTMDRLVLTSADERGGKPTGGNDFFLEMEIEPASPGPHIESGPGSGTQASSILPFRT